ncbi:MAG: MFS transporter, partial [Methanospirillum sp.]|nr:MFS transporter [Methanospirillum sp.]
MLPITSNHLQYRLLLVAVAIGMFLDGLDGSIVMIILPGISESFGTDTGTASWVIITYLLMIAGLILIVGKTTERGHTKKIFLCGLGMFILGSAACGFSPDLPVLLASRVLQGAGAAMIAATASLLCVTYLPKDMLGMALGAISMSVSVGVAAGPAIGGFIAEFLSWHWAFLINVPIGLLILPFAMYVIPPDIPREKQPFDAIGAALLFGLMASGVYLLERLSHRGIGDMTILLSMSLCVICLVAFILREQTCRTPIMNLRIFTSWRFTATLVAFLIFGCVYMGVLYLLPFFFQAGMAFDPGMSGLFLLIPPVLTAIIGIPMGRWSDRIGRRPFAIAAALSVILATGILMVILPDTAMVPLLVALLSLGIFWGCAGGPVASRVVETAPAGEEGTGSSLMVTAIYLGSVLGTALFATVFTAGTAGEGIVAFSEMDPAA